MKYYLHFTAKFICFLLLNFCCSSLSAQVTFTSYHKKDGTEIKQRDSAYFLRMIHVETKNKDKAYRIEEFYLHNDSVKLNGVSKNALPPYKFEGRKYEFHENGILKSLENFNDGNLIDSAFYLYPNNKLEMITFYPSNLDKKGKLQIGKPIYVVYYDSLHNKTLENGNGFIRLNYGWSNEEGEMKNNLREGEWKGHMGKDKFIETYTHGKLVSGTKTKANGEVIQYDSTNFMSYPDYPGGISRLMGFIASHYNYTREAISNNVHGIVAIEFTIDKEGNPKDMVVKKDLGFGTGEEGIRVLKKAGKWKPGIQRGEKVNVKYTIPIRLNLSR
ncbi:energy transducer TonB [Sphingobacterium sp. DR205]|uniref:energy transducer TonB n=1 Tax=Sphingobacterium sp. DR205 TaxID=2713573 RepID=UPI0013E4EF7C|nr:energy transducer TonB [Sphingobacterium sp. DR205]QIH36315.1 hypothetical protein G6053_27085 [Sphingobacterium sp. DR205]